MSESPMTRRERHIGIALLLVIIVLVSTITVVGYLRHCAWAVTGALFIALAATAWTVRLIIRIGAR